MSQTDAYRSAVLPSEAAMIPAAEVEETPPPAAEETTTPAQTPAQEAPRRRSHASQTLERLRSQQRALQSETLTWIDAQAAPVNPANAPRACCAAPSRPSSAGQPPLRQTTSGGAALSTLMRSAARRYTPPPAMRVPGPGRPGQ